MDELTRDILKCIAARYPFSYQDISRLHNIFKSIDIIIERLDKSLAFNLDPFCPDNFEYLSKNSQYSRFVYGGDQKLSPGKLLVRSPENPSEVILPGNHED